jgi:SMI1/KNR4 family protein SUKH-1
VRDEHDLLDQIRSLRLDATRRTSMAKFGNAPELYPPVSVQTLTESERRLKFRFPELLRTLYLEIGNGGFGPGYGLWGLPGGHPTSLPMAANESNIVDSYLEALEICEEEGLGRMGQLLMICDWGCCNGSGIDCSIPTGEMVFFRDDGTEIREGLTFHQWMEDWARGVDLWERAYKKLP